MVGDGGPATGTRRRWSVLQLNGIEFAAGNIRIGGGTFTHDSRTAWGIIAGKVLAVLSVMCHLDNLPLIADQHDGSILRLLLLEMLTDHGFIDHKCLDGHRVDRISTHVTIIEAVLVCYGDGYQAVAHGMSL